MKKAHDREDSMLLLTDQKHMKNRAESCWRILERQDRGVWLIKVPELPGRCRLHAASVCPRQGEDSGLERIDCTPERERKGAPQSLTKAEAESDD